MSPANVETMFSVREVPWHKMGTIVQDKLVSREAIIAAELDWEVVKTPIYVLVDNNVVLVKEKVAVMRVTDRRVYATVTPKFEPIQNVDAFQFFDRVVGTEVKYDVAGALNNGARIWMTARLPKTSDIAGEEMEDYLLLVNSHDGSLALQMFFTKVRVVCANTLDMALNNEATRFYFRHVKGVHDKIDDAKEILGFAVKANEDTTEKMNALIAKKWTEKQMAGLLNAVLKPEVLLLNAGEKAIDFTVPNFQEKARVEVGVRLQKTMNDINRLVYEGKGQDNPAIQGTAYQAYNAVTEYTDHARAYKQGKELSGIWFGTGRQMRERALSYLLKA